MNHSREHIQYLWERYLSEKASKTELQQLFSHIRNAENDTDNQFISQEMMESYPSSLPPSQPDELAELWQGVLAGREAKSIKNAVKPVHRVHFLKTAWFRYAAAVIVVVGMAAYLWSSNKKAEQVAVSDNKELQADVAPARDRAILTLADGQKIILDSTQGNITSRGGLTVVNLDGKLKFDGKGAGEGYNTISTPKGGQYQVILPDGSKIWLNAASSIRFPAAFTDSERNVEMKGEAYMEIAKNANQSFTVTANGVKIQVLGTGFNINAYEDESVVKTTLVEGSVKVMSGTAPYQKPEAVILKPGQQAIAAPLGQQQKKQAIRVQTADLEQALAWKNGVFRFNQANIEDVMRQLTRWYDIEVVYENDVSGIRLVGEIERNLTLSQMLDGLKELGVKFRMERKRLILL